MSSARFPLKQTIWQQSHGSMALCWEPWSILMADANAIEWCVSCAWLGLYGVFETSEPTDADAQQKYWHSDHGSTQQSAGEHEHTLMARQIHTLSDWRC